MNYIVVRGNVLQAKTQMNLSNIILDGKKQVLEKYVRSHVT